MHYHWGEKPYYSLDFYLKETFGEKLYKVSLNANMTCPNRDGTLGYGGCIFCSEKGSGDFSELPTLSITHQIDSGFEKIQKKYGAKSCIAYFQAFTNTYAPIDYLKQIFEEAIAHPRVRVLSIATRPDCLPPEVLSLLQNLKKKKPVWIELGLQTIHERSAHFIRRKYPLSTFEKAVSDLQKIEIPIIVHTILGLPMESTQDILETMDYLNHCPIQGVKLQLLHVIQGTDLADFYEKKGFSTFSQEEYIDLLGKILAKLSPNIVIHRLTGDGPSDLLVAPLWSTKKRVLLNQLHHHLKTHQIWQGKEFYHG